MSRLRAHPESHLVERIGWLRAAVLGANDGIVSTASLIVGVAAAAATQKDVLIAGVAGLVAGAMSMAAGEYVSVSSQSDTEKADIARERKELSENPQFEQEELTEIYVKRGVEPALAQQIAQRLMAKDALGAHARDELGYRKLPQSASRASGTYIGRDVCGRGRYATAYGSGGARRYAGYYRICSVFGLPSAARCNQCKGRWCKYPAGHGACDVLGCLGDGTNRRYRKIVRHSRVKIEQRRKINMSAISADGRSERVDISRWTRKGRPFFRDAPEGGHASHHPGGVSRATSGAPREWQSRSHCVLRPR